MYSYTGKILRDLVITGAYSRKKPLYTLQMLYIREDFTPPAKA